MSVKIWTFLMIVLFVSPISRSDDFYELLGVAKDADNREIRKAFKKLAVTLHPDKNQDDEDAHDKFVKLARAYETLKDPDLRKHYDLYGDEGSSKSRRAQPHYQSWSYYRDNFGIYDDDPEIITLGRAEFEQSVSRSWGEQDAWFINFYSAMCSHCHQLAPIWRRFARRMEGVVRVGAVNCEEDWELCRKERVHSYPTLLYYSSGQRTEGERFYGERSEDSLVEFVLERLKATVPEKTHKSWDSQPSRHTRILFFSDESGDGPSEETRKKLSIMLEGLADVGHVNCEKESKMCESLGATSGAGLWLPGVKKEGVQFLPGLEAQELLAQILAHLPEPPLLDEEEFLDMQSRLELGTSPSWLIYFHLGEPEKSRLELRRLPAKLSTMRVGRVNCGRTPNLCNNLHIHRYPVYGVFKEGGSYELHHGRSSASDIAQFARESSAAPHVRTLTPAEFGANAPLTSLPLLVDYFAPWCPPCLRLLPELRRASQKMGDVVLVGTVDCTIHSSLCRKMGVQSYPTTRLYNGSKVEAFSGEHRAQSIVEFLEDMMTPLVRELNQKNFYDVLGEKPEDELWLVDYFAPWCGPCRQLAPEWRKLAKVLTDIPFVRVGSVNCETQRGLCAEQGISSYPSIRLYPTGSRGLSQVALYSGMRRDSGTLRQWAMSFVPSDVEVLVGESKIFSEHVLKSGKPWVVDFYAPWCGHCHVFAPEFEVAARKLSDIGVSSGKMDCQDYRNFCQSIGIRGYPTVRLFLGNDGQSSQGIELTSQSASSIIELVKMHLGSKKSHDEL